MNSILSVGLSSTGLRLAPQVRAADPQLALIGADQGGHRSDERRLPGAVGAQDGDDLPGLGHQVEPIQGHGLAEPLPEAPRFDHRCHDFS
jgi:hypothetical protein